MFTSYIVPTKKLCNFLMHPKQKFSPSYFVKAITSFFPNIYTVLKDLKIKKIVLSNLKEKQKQMCDEDSLKKVEKALNEAINMGKYS